MVFLKILKKNVCQYLEEYHDILEQKYVFFCPTLACCAITG
jgi:hypothetical protein